MPDWVIACFRATAGWTFSPCEWPAGSEPGPRSAMPSGRRHYLHARPQASKGATRLPPLTARRPVDGEPAAEQGLGELTAQNRDRVDGWAAS